MKDENPLFIPLKSEYYDAFCSGAKTVEYRKHGPRWNAETCRIGRRVTISRGYGKKDRRQGVVVGFEAKVMDSHAWLACYGSPGFAACIKIELDAD